MKCSKDPAERGSDIGNMQQPPAPRRYANVLLDYWFKRTFIGTPDRKRLLLLLLRELIPERDIQNIDYADTEAINPLPDNKGIRVDVECTAADGTRFVVEMQRATQEWFYDRALFNATFAVQKQMRAEKVDSFRFPPVYFIGIMDFSIRKEDPRFLFRYQIADTVGHIPMTDSLQFLFLELPKCSGDPAASVLEKFGYALHNLHQLTGVPDGFSEEVLRLLFKSAEIAKFTPDERNKYENDMTTERDIRNQIEYARKEGREEGREEGRAEGLAEGETRGREEGLAEGKKAMAAAMKAEGLDPALIEKLTGIRP